MENATLNKPEIQRADFKDIHQRVTDVIIQQLEAGTIPWQKSWTGDDRNILGLPLNYTTGNYYQGVNIVLLWSSAMKNNFTTDEWAGFYQWQGKKEAIRKGEKGSLIVYYNTVEKEVDGELKNIPFLKTSLVFNRCQLANYVREETNSQDFPPTSLERIAKAEEFIENTKAIVQQHDGGACYIPSSDKIMMPYNEKFVGTTNCTATEGFYSTLFHELTHWSGAKHRLNRKGGLQFGDQDYSAEELVAEFGAAFLCAGFGLATVEKGDHAGYIDHWLKVLKEDNRFVIKAASEASKAVDYLHQLKP